MATFSTVQAGGTGSPKIYKWAGVDCIAGETLDTVSAAGYSYAVLYGVEDTDTAGTGTGLVHMRAVLPDAAASAIFNGIDTDADGALDSELSVMQTTATVIRGSVLELLPEQFALVHNGGNTGTALTIDLYLELHE
jgi:hypothetical protein